LKAIALAGLITTIGFYLDSRSYEPLRRKLYDAWKQVPQKGYTGYRYNASKHWVALDSFLFNAGGKTGRVISMAAFSAVIIFISAYLGTWGHMRSMMRTSEFLALIGPVNSTYIDWLKDSMVPKWIILASCVPALTLSFMAATALLKDIRYTRKPDRYIVYAMVLIFCIAMHLLAWLALGSINNIFGYAFFKNPLRYVWMEVTWSLQFLKPGVVGWGVAGPLHAVSLGAFLPLIVVACSWGIQSLARVYLIAVGWTVVYIYGGTWELKKERVFTYTGGLVAVTLLLIRLVAVY